MAQAKIYQDKLHYLGFCEDESYKFSHATTPSGELQPFDEIFASKGFQKIIQARQELIARNKKKGFTGAQIAAGIEYEYKLSHEKSPFSLLKDEYRPNPKPRLDFNEGMRHVQSVRRNKRLHR